MEDESKAGVPDTSTTLLRDVADSQNARWAVFHSRYEPMMRAFMRERFPSLDADDVIQETFLALVKALPNYVYNPSEKGHFHNYLTGILRNKSLKALASQSKARLAQERASSDPVNPSHSSLHHADAELERQRWREAVYEIALRQLLADDSIHGRTKQVFVRLAIDGETPESVAQSLGIPYNTVIKMKERTLRRLRKIVEAMKNA